MCIKCQFSKRSKPQTSAEQRFKGMVITCAQSLPYLLQKIPLSQKVLLTSKVAAMFLINGIRRNHWILKGIDVYRLFPQRCILFYLIEYILFCCKINGLLSFLFLVVKQMSYFLLLASVSSPFLVEIFILSFSLLPLKAQRGLSVGVLMG